MGNGAIDEFIKYKGAVVMMKRIVLAVMAVILVLNLAACGRNRNGEMGVQTGTEKTVEQVAGSETEQTTDTDPDPTGGQEDQSASNVWPTEFSDWDIPVLSKGTVAFSENKSISGGVITQGINVVVNLKNVSKENFVEYCSELEKTGFVKSTDSLADAILYYEKSIDGGNIKLTLSYADNGATIIANNSAAAENSTTSAMDTKNGDWPESLKGIPEFTKGNYKETLEMGGNMYAITYTGITEYELEWYRNTLKKAGFESQQIEDSEGYMKMDKDTAFSVGFNLSGDTLQIVAAIGTY